MTRPGYPQQPTATRRHTGPTWMDPTTPGAVDHDHGFFLDLWTNALTEDHVTVRNNYAFLYRGNTRLNPEFVRVVRRVDFGRLEDALQVMKSQVFEHRSKCEGLDTGNETSQAVPATFKLFSMKRTFYDAKKFCESKGGHLPDVRSPTDEFELRSLMAELHIKGVHAGIILSLIHI